ncbi:hypothetical protein KAI19_03760 [bacterium]|nr:hypothetical protein [bacterium]
MKNKKINPFVDSIYELEENNIYACALYDPENKEILSRSFYFNSEIKNNGFQDFVEKYISKVIGHDLFFIKESPRVNGEIDFIGFDIYGRVFFIEVKCAYDHRAKFEVIFQSLKYCLSVDSEIETDLISLQNKIMHKFSFGAKDFQTWLIKVNKNFSNHQINPIIVVDHLTSQLFATAYSIYLKNFGGEIRIIEMNLHKIKNNYFVYSKKYNFSNNQWLGGSCRNNRKPTEYTNLEEKINKIENQHVRELVAKFLKSISFSKDLPLPAKNSKCFTIIPHTFYFSYDPTGKLPQGVAERTQKPDNQYRFLIITSNERKMALSIGFKEIQSFSGKRIYYEFSIGNDANSKNIKNILLYVEDLRERLTK